MDAFYLRAFGELDTCRSEGAGLGKIPWTAIVQYGDRAGLSPDMVDNLVLIIRMMDGTYRKWQDAEAKRLEKIRRAQIGNRAKAK